MSDVGDLLHGGALDAMKRAFPDAPAPWLDLSTGINPRPWPAPPPAPASLARLPGADAWDACRTAMAEAFGADPEAVLPVPGSEIAIRLLPLVRPARRVALRPLSYGDHRRAWAAAGAALIVGDDPLGADEADVAVLCNPDNPDGRIEAPDRLLAARERLAARGGLLVVDEAYADLDPAGSLAGRAGAPGLVLLRSFGKFYGLGGVRLGALLGPPAIVAAMRSLIGIWGVSGHALEIGAAAYRDFGWQGATRARLARESAALDARLTAAGLEIAGGTALFRLVRAADAEGLWRHLGTQGIYVRRFADHPGLLRLGLPTDAAAGERLSAALAERG